MSNKILQLAAMAAMGMASMADAGMADVYKFTNPYCGLPPITFGSGPRKIRVRDNKSFAKKVEKRRKKNKNKKTHRR